MDSYGFFQKYISFAVGEPRLPEKFDQFVCILEWIASTLLKYICSYSRAVSINDSSQVTFLSQGNSTDKSICSFDASVVLWEGISGMVSSSSTVGVDGFETGAAIVTVVRQDVSSSETDNLVGENMSMSRASTNIVVVTGLTKNP
jgi:hypothetical protein